MSTPGFDDYEYFDALDRLDVVFEDFSSMSALIDRLDELVGRRGGRASIAQIDRAVDYLGYQRMVATDLGYSIDRFTRGGRVVTQLRDARGRFVASTDIISGATDSSTRRNTGAIAAALRRGAG